MRLGKGGAESGPATAARVVKILEEYVGGLPVADPDEPCSFVRTWTLTRNVSDVSLSDTVLPKTSLQVGCSVVRRFGVDDRPGEADDQRTYEQLVGCAQALAAHGFGTQEVREGWRTVALDVCSPSDTRITESTIGDSADKTDKTALKAETAEKAEKKRRRGLRRPDSEPVATA